MANRLDAEEGGDRLGRHGAERIFVDVRRVVSLRGVLHDVLPVALDVVLCPPDRHKVGQRPRRQGHVDVTEGVLEWQRLLRSGHEEEALVFREAHRSERPLGLLEARRHLFALRYALERARGRVEGPSVVRTHNASAEAARLFTRQSGTTMSADVCEGSYVVILAAYDQRRGSTRHIHLDEAALLLKFICAACKHPRWRQQILDFCVVPCLGAKHVTRHGARRTKRQSSGCETAGIKELAFDRHGQQG